MSGETLLSTTESVCPVCLARIPAQRLSDGGRVVLRKRCPAHGPFQAVVWCGEPPYSSWSRPKKPSYQTFSQTGAEKGCPLDCGLCPEHRRQTCCTLIEVTQRCNLRCPVCFADAGKDVSGDLSLNEIRGMLEKLLVAAGPCNLQLSGGEPTVREDLPEIVALGRSMGFEFIQLNTNGLRLAEEPGYARKLEEAGLSCVFLQFDGLQDDTFRKLRGRPLAREKQAAVTQCIGHGLGVILVPTLVPGVNIHEIGPIIEYAREKIPGVRGVHFQPVSYLGRYSGLDSDLPRLTIPEIITELERQSGGIIRAEHFRPPGAENSYCSFHANYVLMPEGELKTWTVPDAGNSCCGGENTGAGGLNAQLFQRKFWKSPEGSRRESREGLGLGGWDVFVERIRTHSFCISGMAFQDAWTLDLDRLRECHLHVLHPDGRLVPFCAYNLTDINGHGIYRNTNR